MEREKIELTEQQHSDLCMEEYLELNGDKIDIQIVENEYTSSGRHQEYHTLVFKIISTGKYYRTDYSNSVKDSMGWSDCNHGPYEAHEVFPETITKTIYK